MVIVWLFADVASENEYCDYHVGHWFIGSHDHDLLESVALHIIPLPCCCQLATVFGVIYRNNFITCKIKFCPPATGYLAPVHMLYELLFSVESSTDQVHIPSVMLSRAPIQALTPPVRFFTKACSSLVLMSTSLALLVPVQEQSVLAPSQVFYEKILCM